MNYEKLTKFDCNKIWNYKIGNDSKVRYL
jgi:hypothetical protein